MYPPSVEMAGINLPEQELNSFVTVIHNDNIMFEGYVTESSSGRMRAVSPFELYTGKIDDEFTLEDLVK